MSDNEEGNDAAVDAEAEVETEASDDAEVNMDDWAAAMEEAGSPMEESGTPMENVAEAATSALGAENVTLDKLHATNSSGEDLNLDVILDIPVTISMEIGSTKINIRNLLQLNQGSVVELDRMAGEPLDVVVNGTLIAHGEVVVVNEKFGIRLTDIISPAERVRKLK